MFLKFFGLRRRNTIIVFWFARFCNTCVIFIFGMHNSRISPMCDDSVAIGRFGRLAALQSKKQKIKESTAVTSPEFGGDLVTVSRGSSGLKPLPSQRCAPKFRVPSCTGISLKEQLENLETISQVPFLVLESESQAPDCSFVQSAGVQGCGVEKIGAQADM